MSYSDPPLAQPTKTLEEVNHPTIRHTGHLLTTELAQTLACSLILSRIDYCNAVLHGAPSYSIKKLQRVQNNAAGIVLEAQDDPTLARC